ncbi:EamA family transporter [Solirubrobacter sp. CPCC 204708]|uniref:EamA family transporter n=1 Tax=Solirubrobacter deserti TaxID=2282478 RepID=A0ABT4RH25_9ACTN|nr:EamA family transporter [Solirubrobacter deserti]MBE2315167.1 EamA family transporter [Solirubrobacter deserti]MDA0137850.1 EamA family transporter [Solirubrobacter deserti]
MPRRHVAIAVLVALTWGVNFVVLHVGLESFPPLLFTGLRFALVALLIPFVPRPGVAVKWVIAVGLFMSAGQHAFVTLGLHEGMPAGLASLVLQLQAAFTIGFAVLLLGERPRRAQLLGGAIALGGIAIIAAGRGSHIPLGALLLTIGGACSWGVGNVAARRATSPNPLGLLVWSSLVPPLPLFSLSAIFERGEVVALDTSGLLALAYVVVLSTVGGFGAWVWLLRQHPASTVAPFTLLVPVFGIASAWLLLSETPSASELLGAGVVLVGIAFTLGLTVPGRASRTPTSTPLRRARRLWGTARP